MASYKFRFIFLSIYAIGIILFSLPGCEDSHHQKALNDLFAKTTYDTRVVHDLPLYDSLKKIFISNLDTIFKFRDARTSVHHGGGDSDTLTHEPHDFYMFAFKGDRKDDAEDDLSLKTLPAFIYPAVKNIFEALGEDKIGVIVVWTDSTFEIPLRGGFSDEKANAEVRHTLRWKRAVAKEPLIKDTIIAPGWTYEISVTEHKWD